MSGGDHNLTPLPLGLAPGRHLEPEDLMAYALELLSVEELAVAETHLAGEGGCAVCREELAAIREDLGIFAQRETPAAEAPATGRDRLLAAIVGVRQDAPSSAVAAKPAAATVSPAAPALGVHQGGRPARMPAWVGWAVAAALAIAAVHYYQGRESLRQSVSGQAAEIDRLSADQARARAIVSALTDPAAQRVTLSLTKAPAPPQPTGRATYLPGRGTLVFLASHLAPLPAGKTYELWVIPANGTAPVAAGLFKPDTRGSASVVTGNLGQSPEAKAFGVTIEPEGGSPSPTMPIVLAGS